MGDGVHDRLRAEALRLFRVGLAAADPARAVTEALRARPLPPPGPGGRRLVIAIGKAAPAMAIAARAALAATGEHVVTDAIVVTQDGNDRPVSGMRVIAAGHPVPDARGAAAAEAVIAALRGLGPRDQVLALISGGGSALLPAPVEGVSLDDKIAVTRLLLASGAEIGEINLVRQNLSRLKGGGLARLAAPATVTALILSDVVGDDLRAIASGPTVAPLGDRALARAILDLHGVWDRAPESVRRHLLLPADPSPVPAADNRLVGSNTQSLAAMAAAGARVWPRPLTGDVEDAAHEILAAVQALPPGTAMAFGGETTVRVTGRGQGGRNQELALRFALAAVDRRLAGPWAFLAAGTDGRDGPTDAAGGVSDDTTPARARGRGLDLEAALADNDSHAALRALGDLVATGPTGTNVADLAVFVRG